MEMPKKCQIFSIGIRSGFEDVVLATQFSLI